MEIHTRTKPTKHKQDCHYCNEAFEKGEQQTLWVEKEWGFGHAFTTSWYFHPKCAMKFALTHEGFPNHFRHAYSKELDAKSFKEICDSRRWNDYRAFYITNPFFTFLSFHLTDGDGEKLLEEVFTEIVFDKVMNNGR